MAAAPELAAIEEEDEEEEDDDDVNASCECAADTPTAAADKSRMNICPLEAPQNAMSWVALQATDSMAWGKAARKHVFPACTSNNTTERSIEHDKTRREDRLPMTCKSFTARVCGLQDLWGWFVLLPSHQVKKRRSKNEN